MSYLTAPAHVRAVDFGHLLALLNTRTGQVTVLDGVAKGLWYAGLHPADAHPGLVTRRLLDAGFLTLSAEPRPWPAPTVGRASTPSWGTQTVPLAVERLDPTNPGARLVAVVALAATLLARYLGRRTRAFFRLLTLARVATGCGRRPADTARTRAAVHAVRRMARAWPARIACLEESVAATVVLALRGRHAGWCHGIAPDPIHLHAWLAVDGRPVAEPESTSRYTVVIGPHHTPGGARS